jgi:hypothetical protein
MRPALIVVLLSAAVGCSKDNPFYCPSGDCPPDAAVTTGCMVSPECAGDPAGEVCDTAGRTCVECLPAEAAACMGATPVCGDDHSCRACEADAECGSGVCRHDGTCAAAATVIYAAPAAIGVGDCSTPANACDLYEANDAVDGTRTIIHLAPGTYNLEAGRLMVDVDVTLVGRGAIVRRNANLGPVIETMNSADLTLEFATVRDGAGDGSDGDGIICNSGSALRLRAVTVDSCDESGIDANNCTLSIEGSTFSGNTGGGISSTGGSFEIANTFIVRNGNNGSNVGGVLLSSTQPSVFRFNTVADNDIADISQASGVHCASNMVTGGFNLLYRNRIDGTATGPAQQNNMNCSGASSVVELNAGTIMFASETPPYDYHLTAGSPPTVKNAAGATCAVATDVDGQARPNEGGCDIGADEYYPAQ